MDSATLHQALAAWGSHCQEIAICNQHESARLIAAWARLRGAFVQLEMISIHDALATWRRWGSRRRSSPHYCAPLVPRTICPATPLPWLTPPSSIHTHKLMHASCPIHSAVQALDSLRHIRIAEQRERETAEQARARLLELQRATLRAVLLPLLHRVTDDREPMLRGLSRWRVGAELVGAAAHRASAAARISSHVTQALCRLIEHSDRRAARRALAAWGGRLRAWKGEEAQLAASSHAVAALGRAMARAERQVAAWALAAWGWAVRHQVCGPPVCHATLLRGGDTTATRLLHGCYTTVTRLLHDCHATVTRRLHGGYTAAARLLQVCYTAVTRPSGRRGALPQQAPARRHAQPAHVTAAARASVRRVGPFRMATARPQESFLARHAPIG